MGEEITDLYVHFLKLLEYVVVVNGFKLRAKDKYVVLPS